MTNEVWLVRHGETDWARESRHTGRTDVSLNARGREQAAALPARLRGMRFALVLTSTLKRARETCRLAGFEDVAAPDPDLQEWNYGQYEGRTREDIRQERPGWTVWRDGAPGGEAIGDVVARVTRVIARVRAAEGPALLFGHGHCLRVLASCWIEAPPETARGLTLEPASISRIGYERDTPSILTWNAGC